jgi:hypothetical protein
MALGVRIHDLPGPARVNRGPGPGTAATVPLSCDRNWSS